MKLLNNEANFSIRDGANIPLITEIEAGINTPYTYLHLPPTPYKTKGRYEDYNSRSHQAK